MLKNNFTNLFTQWFDKPKVSVFNLSKPVRTDIQIGKWYPTYWTICGFGDSEKGHSNHKLRLAPMVAPNFADLRVNEHAVVVPLRVIMKDYEARFNYSKNRDGASLPTLSLNNYVSVLTAMCKKGISPIGSLFDFLGFPVYGDYYKALRSSFINTSPTEEELTGIFNIPYFSSALGSSASLAFVTDNYPLYQALLGFSYRDIEVATSVNSAIEGYFSLFAYAGIKYMNQNGISTSDSTRVQDMMAWTTLWSSYISKFPAGDELTHLVEFLGNDLTVVSLIDEYYTYLFGQTLHYVLPTSSSNPIPYSILPLMAYHRAVADWAINSNVTDPDVYLQTYVYDLKSNLLEYAQRINHEGEPDVDYLTEDELNEFITMVTPKDRLWDLDYFTSQLPTSTQGDDILIPANSSVIDLAKLTAIQKLAMKLSFSSRYRDVIWNIFNIRPSDARLQQSSVIQSNNFFVQIGETIQTSETTVSSVLGAFGGRGFSAGSKKGFHIFCEEPCVVLNFFSMVAKPSYMDALHPLIHVDDIFDFPIPDMDVLGNQPQYTDLLTGNPADNVVLGFSRQYMEWLGQFGTVHNNMKTSLDYWTLGRRFDTTPALNEEFLTINPKDDFDRIFSVPDSSHAFVEIYYDVKVTRPVRRSVRILV